MPFGSEVALINSGFGEQRTAFAPHKSQISGNLSDQGFASAPKSGRDRALPGQAVVQVVSTLEQSPIQTYLDFLR